ncbi:MAG: ABC transporter substrate-binding protein [Parvibaculaceae bacterium]
MKTVLRSVCFGSSLLALVGLSGMTFAAAGEPIRILRTTAPDNIDPALTCTIFGGSLVNNLYDRLVEYKKAGDRLGPDVEPMVAQSWQVSDDGREYRFALRPGLKFASGNPITAEDVVYSLERTRKLGGCQGYNLEGGQTGNITSIEAVDAATVVVRMKNPDPLFLTDLTNNIGIIDKAVLEANGGLTEAGTAWLSKNAAGSGPFTLGGYDPESQIVLDARPDYWKGPAAASQLIFQIAKDPSTTELLLGSGAADVAYDVPAQDIDRLASLPALKAVAGPSLTFVNVGLNVTRKPLDDIRLRQALSYATPFGEILAAFGGKYSHPLVGPIMIGQPFHQAIENPYPTDVAKATSLIADAGLAGTTLTVAIKSGQTVQQEIATVLQASWKAIGIDLEIKTLGSSAFFDEVMSRKNDMYMIEDKSANPDPAYLLSFFVRCNDPYNWSGYCSETVDRLLVEGRDAGDPQKRAQIYHEIALQVARDAPYLQLFQKDQVVIAAKNVDGFVFSPESEDRFYWLSKN